MSKTYKQGETLSENSYFTVKSVSGNTLNVVDDHGSDLTIGVDYADRVLKSADTFSEEVQLPKTQLADLLINTPRVAMTVCFVKQDKAKTAKQYKAEKAAAIEAVQNAKVSEVEGLLNDLIENPISKVIPGETRVMKGRHSGYIDELGRLQFIDMEAEMGVSTHDARVRQIDPRTVQYIIVNGTKYNLKK